MPTLGTYCGTAATLNISGSWFRFGPGGFGSGTGGTAHKEEWMTLFYKTCTSPTYRINAHGYVGPDGTNAYCADGDIHAVNFQTDCSGNYTISVTGQSIIGCSVAGGKWVSNPGYSPSDAVYNPITQNWIQWILDPATQYRYCGLDVYVGTYGTVFEALPAGYTGGTAATAWTDMTTIIYGGGFQTVCGTTGNPAYGVPAQNCPAGFFSLYGAFSFVSGNPVLSTPLSGTFIIPIRDNTYSEGQGFLTNMIRGGKYYYVANATYQITDACGTVENTTLTTPGSGVPNGGATWSSIDWANITSVVLTSAVPTPGWLDGYPSPSDSNVYGPFTNIEATGTGRLPWNYGTSLTPWLHDCCQHSFNLNVILVPPLPVSPITLIADYCEGTITVAWIDQANNLKVSNHRSVAKHVGDAMPGWDVPYILSTGVTTKMGMTYLINKLLYIEHDGGAHPAYTNAAFGLAGNWNSTGASGGFSNGNPGPRTRGRSSIVQFGGIHLDPAFDYSAQGAFAGGVNMGTAPQYLRAGFVDVGGHYLILWTNTFGTTLMQKSTDGNTWAGSTTVSAITGYVASLVRLPSGTLLGLSYDPTAKLCTPFRSRDMGATWEFGSSTTPQIPAMDGTPPMLVSTPTGVYAVWVLNDQPNSAFTSDEGNSWT